MGTGRFPSTTGYLLLFKVGSTETLLSQMIYPQVHLRSNYADCRRMSSCVVRIGDRLVSMPVASVNTKHSGNCGLYQKVTVLDLG